MTDNENKLDAVTKQYKVLKILGDLLPAVGMVFLTVIIGLELGTLPYILKIQTFEKAQEDYRKEVIQRINKIDSVEQKIISNQITIDSKLDLIIITQSKAGPINKSTLDSLKAYLFQNYKSLK